jgi:N-acetylglucosamine-6-phosphate deacetylase
MKLSARHYATGELLDLRCEYGRIAEIETVPNTQYSVLSTQYSVLRTPYSVLSTPFVAPALFDLQINGCHGHSFNSERLTLDAIREVVQTCRQHGIGALCATLVTNSAEALLHGFSTLRMACEAHADIGHAIPAIHLEGPYISPEDGPRGAHPKRHVRPPDWDEFRRFQDAAGGRIRLLTLAPEHDGALPFIEKVVTSGVVIAIGHTAATGVRIREAVAAGARLSTHLGNGSHAILPRHENYIWEQLANDDLWASLICDGHHLPPAVIKCILRVKTPARSILTCDCGSLAGLPPGRYKEWDTEFEVHPAGKIVVPGTSYLAGSWAFTDLCVGNAMTLGGVSLRDAVDMAGANPRKLLGLPTSELTVGAPADFVLFESEPGRPFRVLSTVIGGETVWSVT